jgi:hypothetical protein
MTWSAAGAKNAGINILTRTLPSNLANCSSRVSRAFARLWLHPQGLPARRVGRVPPVWRNASFHPGVCNSVGAKITEVQVNHQSRKFGKTKYGLERTIKVLLDLFTVKFLVSYSSKPIYLFGGAGLGPGLWRRRYAALPICIRRMCSPASRCWGRLSSNLSVMLFDLGVSIGADGLDCRDCWCAPIMNPSTNQPIASAKPSICLKPNPEMKILVLIHEFPPVGGGGGRAAQDICRKVGQRGHEINCPDCALKGTSQRRNCGRDSRVLRLPSLRREAFRADRIAMGAYVLAGLWAGYRLIRHWQPDVIHVHFAVPAGALAWRTVPVDAHSLCMTVHLGDVPGGVPEKTSGWFKWALPFTRRIWREAKKRGGSQQTYPSTGANITSARSRSSPMA